MADQRPYVLSIAGFDPSAGAGILADIKTFEQMEVYGLGAVSAITVQNDNHFEKLEWMSFSTIMEQVNVLRERFKIRFIKVGLVRDLDLLYALVNELRRDAAAAPAIVWDPVIRSSSGFSFHETIDQRMLEAVCSELFLLTPNMEEALLLGPEKDAEKNALYLSRFCKVLLKGGHRISQPAEDLLYSDGTVTRIGSEAGKLSPKHGSGCVLSSAITALLARGLQPEQACLEAKSYTEEFLRSNGSLLGYHAGIKTGIHE